MAAKDHPTTAEGIPSVSKEEPSASKEDRFGSKEEARDVYGTLNSLLEQGADVIATDLSAASALNAAEQQGRFSVGFQIDMSPHAPNGHLASVLLVWAPYLTDAIRKIQAGEWEPSEWGAFIGMETGSVALAGLPDDLPAEVMEKVEAARQAIIDGSFTPFDGPMKNQAGEQVLAEGESLDDGALWKMDYFVEGIVGTMPSSN